MLRTEEKVIYNAWMWVAYGIEYARMDGLEDRVAGQAAFCERAADRGRSVRLRLACFLACFESDLEA